MHGQTNTVTLPHGHTDIFIFTKKKSSYGKKAVIEKTAIYGNVSRILVAIFAAVSRLDI
jgi:hypothetical protein